MILVKSRMNYHKVVTNAPMVLHTAIAIGVHDKYTISDLFPVLRQRNMRRTRYAGPLHLPLC